MLTLFDEFVKSFGSVNDLLKVNKAIFYPEQENYKFCPKANIYNSDKNSKIILQIPGFLKEDITIDVDENQILKINGKNKIKNLEKITREEIYFEDFYRSFQLTENHDKDKIEAKLENGLLEIIIPIKEKEKNNQIKIKIK